MTPQKPLGTPSHNRKLALSGISLTRARLHRDSGKALDHVRNELERLLIESGYLRGAPFVWVGLSIRYGLTTEEKPHFQRIDQKDGELPLAIEVDTHELLGASFDNLICCFRRATLIALIHAGNKYQRPVTAFETELATMPQRLSSDDPQTQSNVA